MNWIKSPKDFWSGVMFMTFGALAFVVSGDYRMGTAARMGPGYFPRALGMLLVILGTVIALRGLRNRGDRVPPFLLRPLVFVLGTVVLFGLVVPYTGVVLGTVLLIFVASYASHEFRWKDALISALVLSVTAVLVFVVGLDLQLPVWPWPWNQ